ncbi:unnamed protein product [Parnassius mnemosyne]|uniref:Zinc finger protein n=1 Tax=Parnassius mnemosyne TaxID=213953 RepID=A0AAV1LM85_9NEOP
MTTIFLAHKLMSVKLDKTEFENIKHQKIKNMKERQKNLYDLRNILAKNTFEKNCRLCLKPGIKNIFENNREFDHLHAIKTFFGIEISENDGKPQYICESCETTIKMAARLKDTAVTSQWRLQHELEIVSELAAERDTEAQSETRDDYFNTEETDILLKWVCDKCRRVFLNQDEFKEHELLLHCQTKVRSYICETCGFEFKTIPQLKRHRSIHTEEPQYRCVQCSYRGRTRHALAVHLRLHSGERPFHCALCSATFPNASNLASHRRRHLPPAYHCEACQRRFRFKEALSNHIATIHRDAKPFNCSTCGKTFATRKMILRHERNVHNRPKLRSGVTRTCTTLQKEN